MADDLDGNGRLLAMVEERTKNIASDVAEIKLDVKELVRVGADHERRITILEEKQVRQEAERAATSKDLKSVLLPLAVQVVGAGLAFVAYLVAGHALGILH